MNDRPAPLAQLAITIEHASVVNFALQHIDVPLVRRVVIENRGATEVGPLSVHLAIEPGVAKDFRHELIESLRPGETLALDDRVLAMPLSSERLASQLERERGTLTVTVRTPDAERVEVRRVMVHARDEWLEGVHPEALACFVQPAHPALVPLLRRAQEDLLATTGDGALEGYAHGPARARRVALALWDAARAADVRVVGEPAATPDGEPRARRVRSPDATLEERMGSDLDLAVLYAALLERAGLRPFVVIGPGRVVCGAFLGERERLTGKVSDDPTEVGKRLASGAALAVDARSLAGGAASFASAEKAAAEAVAALGAGLAVDIAAARLDGIGPLPLRVASWVKIVDAPAPAAPAAPARSGARAPAAPQPAAEPTPIERRLEKWKSQLLDLSLRNPLLAFKRDSTRCLPLVTHDLARLEDALASAEPFALQAQEDGQRSRVQLERKSGATAVSARLGELLAQGTIVVDLPDGELRRRATELYRQARTVGEETGSTALWLAVGFVEWVDDKAVVPPGGEAKRLLAPIILVPVELVRGSVREDFKLRVADDEPRINSTLLARLASQFKVDVTGADALPEDDAGVDVGKILQTFAALVKPIPHTQIVPQAAVAMFSFAKYMLWLDLEARTEALLGNPVVAHLLAGDGRPYPLARPFVARDALDARRPPAEDLSVVEADSSQLVAVQAAVDGNTFVLEGPPGTGKSQTITNLVAEALGRGQSVLFVAEKRAAVEVVQRRLEAVGLGRFVLDLHAPDQTKAAIVAALAANLDVRGEGDPGALARTGAELLRVRDRLAATWRALHAPGDAAMSPWQAVSRLGALPPGPVLAHDFARGAPTSSGAPGDGQGAFDSVRVARIRELVHALGHASRAVAPMVGHPFAGAGLRAWDARGQAEIAAALDAARPRIDETRRLASEVADLLGLELGKETPDAVRLLSALAGELARAPRKTAAMVADRRHERELQPLVEAVALQEQRRRRWAELAPRWRPELLGLDLDALAATFARWQGAFFLVAFFALFFARRRLAPAAVGKVGGRKEVAKELAAAVLVREDDRRLAERRAQVPEAFAEGTPEELAARLGAARTLLHVRRELAPLTGPIALQALVATIDPAVIGPRAAALEAARTRMDEALGAVARPLELDRAALDRPLAELALTLGTMERELKTLRDWAAWRRARHDATEHGLGTFVAALEDGRLGADTLEPAVEKSLASWRIEQALAAEPVLAEFRGADHEDLAARFRALDAERQAAARGEILLRLAARLPDGTIDAGEVGVLRAESKKKRRHLALRQLFAKISTILPRLKPCVLASPMSVAAYLDPSLPPFDLVVFDEASQIPPWDAIGALGRGKSAVVVGDSKQMPPTDFFGSGDGDDAFAEDEVEELESILDECDRAGLPKLSLSWHYRSRHPSLIHFSNHRYYGGGLIAFPAAAADVPTLGLKWQRVPGRYERGVRRNVIEAEALVADVLARLRDPALCQKSIGVVTFAEPQQRLIVELLDQARMADPTLERFFRRDAAGGGEPVFVKNLENVQGDERDVMFFSVGFGPDAAGKVSMNLGALNRRGGERRLNVAVTRARELLVVYASMDPGQLDVEKTGALGVQHLREFLELAARGGAVREAEEVAARGRDQAGFLAAVEARLRAEGYTVDRDLAATGPRIDLAVADPAAPGRYLLGLVTDGLAWARFPALRDREKLGLGVLANLGWTIHRVFALDAWQDPEREVDRVLARLRQLRAAAPPATTAQAPPAAAASAQAPPAAAAPVTPARAKATPATTATPAPTPTPAAVLAPTGPRPASWLEGAAPWVRSAIPAIAAASALELPGSYAAVAARLAAVVDAEGPVHRDEALRRAFGSWQVARVGPKMARQAELALAALPDAHRPRLDGDFYWPPGIGAAEFVIFRTGTPEARREVEHLPIEEVMNACRALLGRAVGIGRSEVVVQVAGAFGFDRRGKKIEELCARALDRLVADGVVRDVDGRLDLA